MFSIRSTSKVRIAWLLRTSTKGASPMTVTISSTPEGDRVASSPMSLPAFSTTPSNVTVWNPASSTVTA